ncbi:MAG: hypothetical protein GY719_39310 [bacterium]|nr:hypothetical protein [bacterium]
MPPPSPKTPTARPRKRRRKRRRDAVSRMLTHRQKDMLELVASIRSYKGRVAEALRESLAPGLREGETLPDHEISLELIGRSVERAFDRLMKLDDEYDETKNQLTATRREVKRLVRKELYPQAVSVRRAIDSAFGKPRGALIHTFTGRTPRVPDRLTTHVQRALTRLRDPKRELPATRLPGELVDREGWIRRLDKPLRELVDAKKLRGRLESEVESLHLWRQRTMNEFDTEFAEALAHVESTFRLAGLGDQLIKNLRPYYRRRRLRKRARQKRAARADRKVTPLQVVPAATTETSDTPAEDAHRPSEGAVANVSKWLKEKTRLG